ncbi:MAG: NAD(P)/FAD-dependent oxidoreductase [Gemmatimonadaceae bacterium]|nr:NAD(P)/FAD-dependent oxidoreductase [Gemmatimonadaceae bacterium]
MNPPVKDHYQVLIIGGGSAGITVAAHLTNRADTPEIAIIEPATEHYYQPLWTLVGAGIVSKKQSMKPEASLIPRGTTWIRDSVTTIDPVAQSVTLAGGQTVRYEQLVVAAGIQIDWNKIPGLAESVGKPGSGVVSNYDYNTVDATWEAIRTFKGGTAIFTDPKTAVKCGGAPQKIMYLAEEAFQRQGVRKQSRVVFMNAKPVNFTAPAYATTFREMCKERDIEINLTHDLIALHPDKKEAVFARPNDADLTVHYDLIHVTPPQSAPDFLKQSPLGTAEGWVDVDKHTLAHVKYPNVFGLGDCSSLPTSKTGAAIRKQAPVVAENLMALRAQQPLTASYDGYTACPVVTGYGSLVMAEFDYSKEPKESMPFDQNHPRYSMYALKVYALPQMYWHGMLRGRM